MKQGKARQGKPRERDGGSVGWQLLPLASSVRTETALLEHSLLDVAFSWLELPTIMPPLLVKRLASSDVPGRCGSTSNTRQAVEGGRTRAVQR